MIDLDNITYFDMYNNEFCGIKNNGAEIILLNYSNPFKKTLITPPVAFQGGIEYDGSRYVGCNIKDSSTLVFYTSTDLKNWTLAATPSISFSYNKGFTTQYAPRLLFDGTYFRFALYNAASSAYGIALFTFDKNFKQVNSGILTNITYTPYRISNYGILLPGGYNSNSNSVYSSVIIPNGSTSSSSTFLTLSANYSKHLTFVKWNDTYDLGISSQTINYACGIIVYNKKTKTVETTVSPTLPKESTNNSIFCGGQLLITANGNFYANITEAVSSSNHGTSYNKHFVRLDAGADPKVAANYYQVSNITFPPTFYGHDGIYMNGNTVMGTDAKFLPTITPTNAYAYIKVKD